MTRGLAVAICVLAPVAGAARADVVTARWGVKGHVQFPGALTYQEVAGQGTLMRFDLSALPKGATVHRARLVMKRAGGYGGSFEVYPAERVEGKVVPGRAALSPVAPYFRWYDATRMVSTASPADRRTPMFFVRGAKAYDPDATFLEVAYEGQLKDAPQQVTGLRASYRSGQVFLTWTEIEDLSEGQERYAWGDLIKKLRGYSAEGPTPRDDKRELRYRVYRHDRPITRETIGRAALLADVVPGSGFNTRIVRRIWQGENRPSKLDDSFVAVRLGVEPLKPLASGVGVYVDTVSRNGKAYYAVVTAVNGVENTVDISPGNTAGPIDVKVADPEPVLQEETLKKGRKPEEDLVTRRYVYWAVPPQAPRPLQYGLVIQYHPNRIGKPAALEVSHGKGHGTGPNLDRWQRRDAILLATSADPKNGLRVGQNTCRGTLRSFSQGTWGPWTYNRHAKLVAWARRIHEIDEQQIYCYGSHWGMWELRHPKIYAAFIGWGSAELTRGFVDWNRCNGVWGPPSAFNGKPRTENPYEMCNFTSYVAADPSRDLPFQMLIPCTGSHTSEMSFASRPKYMRTLMDAKQPFAGAIGKASWGYRVPAVLTEFRAGRLKIRRDQSKPAFANCTLDDNPGCGDIRSGDKYGLLNGYLLWETETIVDEPGRWAMTVYLHTSAPLPSCTVDVTPRHCQGFKAAPSQAFRWTSTDPADGAVVERGQITADQHGLVTIKRVTVTKAKRRLLITK